MSPAIVEFKHESIQDTARIADYLRALADGISSRKLCFHNEHNEIVMEPQGLINLEVKAKRSGNSNRLSLKLQWKILPTVKEYGHLVIE